MTENVRDVLCRNLARLSYERKRPSTESLGPDEQPAPHYEELDERERARAEGEAGLLLADLLSQEGSSLIYPVAGLGTAVFTGADTPRIAAAETNRAPEGPYRPQDVAQQGAPVPTVGGEPVKGAGPLGGVAVGAPLTTVGGEVVEDGS